MSDDDDYDNQKSKTAAIGAKKYSQLLHEEPLRPTTIGAPGGCRASIQGVSIFPVPGSSCGLSECVVVAFTPFREGGVTGELYQGKAG